MVLINNQPFNSLLMIQDSLYDKSNSTILIVDDQPINIRVLEEIIKREKYNYHITENAADAYKLISKALPDIILLDIMMPGEDGFEFCKKLKDNPRTADIPVIFLTAKVELEDKIHGFKLGAVDYITKPFNPIEVTARLSSQIQLKKSKDFIKNYNQQLEQIIEIRTKELIKSEKQAAFGQLIQGIIHNIRGPVSSAISSFSLIDFYKDDLNVFLKDKTPLPPEVSEKLNEIWDVIKQDEKILNRLLNTIDAMMVKSRSDKSEVVEVIDLNDILRQELEFLNADPKFNKIEKQTLFHPAPLNIKVIPGEISQVFSNIILNAVDALFNRKDAKIIVKSGFSHKFAWFSVEDNGSGIPANIIEKIFDPFYSTKKLKKLENDNSPTGTGIGLHYCRQTIDSYSGKIDVQSKEGFGASFTVSIPLA